MSARPVSPDHEPGRRRLPFVTLSNRDANGDSALPLMLLGWVLGRGDGDSERIWRISAHERRPLAQDRAQERHARLP